LPGSRWRLATTCSATRRSSRSSATRDRCARASSSTAPFSAPTSATDMVPLPIRDNNPTLRAPVITIAIIGINVLGWFYELQHGVALSTLDYGAIPSWLLHGVRDGELLLP